MQLEWAETKQAFGTGNRGLPDFYIEADKLKVLEDWLASGFHVMLTGNPGCGKTAFGFAWARANGLAVHKVNCGAIRSPREWFGRFSLREGVGTVFERTRLAEALEEPGLILLDELNRTHPDNHNSLLNLLDDQREVYVEELGRSIRLHERTLVVATMNTGRQYTGVSALDHAVEDRFQVVRLTLPPVDVMAGFVRARYGVDERVAERIAAVTAKLDELYAAGLLGKTTGMRSAYAAAALVARGNELTTALQCAFVERYAPDGGIESDRTLVQQTIQGLVG